MHPSPSRPGRRRPRRCAVRAPAAVDARAVSAIPAHASPISAGRRTRTMRQSDSSSRSSTRRDTPSMANTTAGSNIGRSAIRLLASCSSGSTSTAKPGARASRALCPRLGGRGLGLGVHRQACGLVEPREVLEERPVAARHAVPAVVRGPGNDRALGVGDLGAPHPEAVLEQVHADRGGHLDAELEGVVRPVVVLAPERGHPRPTGEGRVEQHARLGVAALLLLAHHQLAPPGGGRPVHPPERVAVAVLAGDQLVGVRVGAALQAVHHAVDGGRAAECRVERGDSSG